MLTTMQKMPLFTSWGTVRAFLYAGLDSGSVLKLPLISAGAGKQDIVATYPGRYHSICFYLGSSETLEGLVRFG